MSMLFLFFWFPLPLDVFPLTLSFGLFREMGSALIFRPFPWSYSYRKFRAKWASPSLSISISM